MSHIPVPAISPRVLPALLTLQLPDSVRKRQHFTVRLHQVSTILNRVMGTFELRISVGGAEDFLAQEQRWLAVLRDTLEQRPSTHHWTPVLERLTKVVAGRVRGFGGNPDKIPPSPRGYDDKPRMPCPDPHAHEPDRKDLLSPEKERGKELCGCPACIMLEALDDEKVRRTLAVLLCKRKKC